MAVITTPQAISVNLGGVEVALPDMTLKNRVLKWLFAPDLSASAVTMHDETNGDYQVPTGKRAICLGIIGQSGEVDRVITLISNDTADSSATEAVLQRWGAMLNTVSYYYKIPTTMGIAPSDKFVNIYGSITSGSGNYQVLMLEEDNP